MLPHQIPLQAQHLRFRHLSIVAGSDEAVVGVFEAFLCLPEFEVGAHTLLEALTLIAPSQNSWVSIES